MTHRVFDGNRRALRDTEQRKALQFQFVGNRFEVFGKCIEAQVLDVPIRQAAPRSS
ncbi:MAG: hypothetical protein R8F89_01985 [Roseobacter sp.]|nr:hypothetical protein [Roseobacter sp.]